MTEAEALLAQGLADLRTFRAMLEQDRAQVAECEVLHLLQMAGEKLAKAILYALDPDYRRSGPDRRLSHVSLSKLAIALGGRRRVWQALPIDPDKLSGCLRQFHPWYEQIERLHPQVARGGPNVEYPWADTARWMPPCDYDFGLLARLRRGEGRQSLRFLERLAAAVPVLLANEAA
ncbi:MAG: hypothetical protein IT204_17085 [Fimbriimonadaceae bacterium]|nr:hypothetical protein [Fimbriimonadaceae bacterium]